MSKTVDIDIESGFLNFRMGEVEIQVDVYDVHNRLVDIQRQGEREAESNDQADSDHAATRSLNGKIVELIAELGFPRVPHRAAVQFANAIFAHVEELRKNDVSAPSVSTSAD